MIQPVAHDPSDAALLAKADRIAELREAAHVAWHRAEKLCHRIEATLPPEPPKLDDAAVTKACLKVLRAFPEITDEIDVAVAKMRRTTEARITATWNAFQAERDRLYVETGAKQAEVEQDAADDAVVAAIDEVTGLKAVSLVGVLAKARVYAAPRPKEDGETWAPHEERLILSLMRDLSAMAGERVEV